MVYTRNRDAFSETYLSHKDDVVPMLLTPEILEKNGWRTQNRWYYYLDVAEGFISYIGIDFKHKSNKGHLYVEVNGNNMVEIQYCHELQHFLLGIGLNSEMDVQVWLSVLLINIKSVKNQIRDIVIVLFHVMCIIIIRISC